MIETKHSEYGKIQSIYIKSVQDSFIDQDEITQQWSALNYLGEPDYETAVNEYIDFEEIIKSTGAIVSYFSKNGKVGMDSIYCRDASITTNWGIILCNMGKEGRLGEPMAASSSYQVNGEKILGRIEFPGTLEGGDVAWLDESTLAVGRTYRTNDAGISQIKALLNPFGVKIIQVNLPHYKGPNDVFHLMSVLSPIDKDLAVVYSPLLPISFREELIKRGYKFVEVPEAEFESMGCNVLAIGPRDCVMVGGNPITQQRLQDAGVKVRTYKGKEISVKGGGGPTCLTRPLTRLI